MRTAKLKRRVQFSGVTATAQQIGVSREHLSRVLHGKRKASSAIRTKMVELGLRFKPIKN